MNQPTIGALILSARSDQINDLEDIASKVTMLIKRYALSLVFSALALEAWHTAVDPMPEIAGLDRQQPYFQHTARTLV